MAEGLAAAPGRRDGREGGPRPWRLAVVGVSESSSCGVRDHGRLLAEALEREGCRCTIHWLQRHARSPAGARAEMTSWREGLAAELTAARAEAIVLHYSVFSYAYKGVPVFVPGLMRTLRRSGLPVVVVLHEFAYPWRYGGWRGLLWALSQRFVMRAVIATADAVLVTAEVRRRWLQERRLLPQRPVRVAPVFSNLPAASPQARAEGAGLVGLFGYSYQGASRALVLDALAAVRDRGQAVRLLLLGAPGEDSPSGRAWREQAGERGLAELLAFTGPLPAGELADALARCDVLIFPDTFGPSPRKGTLAGDLASGRPLVALDGPATWRELVAADAAAVVPASPQAFAEAIAALLADAASADALGERGRAFYEREMAVERSAAATLALLDAAVARRDAV